MDYDLSGTTCDDPGTLNLDSEELSSLNGYWNRRHILGLSSFLESRDRMFQHPQPSPVRVKKSLLSPARRNFAYT